MARQSARFYATGRRKTSMRARVPQARAPAQITINGRTSEDYFPREILRMLMLDAARARSTASGNFDMFVTVEGGGDTGQAGAMRHGIARALAEVRPDLCARR